MKLLINLTFLAILTSCGNPSFEKLGGITQQEIVSSQSTVAEELPYTYKFSEKDCSTGEQASKTFAGICKLLSDEALNQNCAQEKRESIFKKESCPGSFS